MSVNGGNGKKSESGKENGGIVKEKRNERGKERENEKETKTVTAGPETGSETETGRGTEVVRGALSAANPGEGKKHHVTELQHKQITTILLTTAAFK